MRGGRVRCIADEEAGVSGSIGDGSSVAKACLPVYAKEIRGARLRARKGVRNRKLKAKNRAHTGLGRRHRRRTHIHRRFTRTGRERGEDRRDPRTPLRGEVSETLRRRFRFHRPTPREEAMRDPPDRP